MNSSSSTSFDRIVQAQHHRPTYGKCLDEQTQQDMTGFQARPNGTIENPMIILKMLLATQSHHSQNSGNRSLCRTQDRSNEQNLCMFPDLLGEQPRKGFHPRDIFGLQGRHEQPLGRVFALAYLAFC